MNPIFQNPKVLTSIVIPFSILKEILLAPKPHDNQPSKALPESNTPSLRVTWGNAAFYVLSGCSQPLIMALCKNAGLADPSCQLYMLFYSLGPSIIMIPLLLEGTTWPSRNIMGP